MTKMHALDLYTNQGQDWDAPMEWSAMAEMKVLDLDRNQLTGTLPGVVGDDRIPAVSQRNQLTGTPRRYRR